MIVRLYFVDAPETDNSFPDRVRTQAEHFGKTPEETLHVGSYAKEATAQLLSRRFTVTTQYEDAMGRSSLPRYYGFVTTAEGEDLGEILVKNGLARAYGRKADPPGRAAPRYDVLEGRAKRATVGLYSSEPLKVIARAGPASTPSPLDRFKAAKATPTPDQTGAPQTSPSLFAGFEEDLGVENPATAASSPSASASPEVTPSAARKNQPWSPEEETTLSQEVHAGKTVDEIAVSHGRTPGAIKARIRKLGLQSSAQTTF